MGAPIAGSVNSVMPVMTPNNDFNAKLVHVRVMMRSSGCLCRSQLNQRRDGVACSFHSQKCVAERQRLLLALN
jgi:hypothetical protein